MKTKVSLKYFVSYCSQHLEIKLRKSVSTAIRKFPFFNCINPVAPFHHILYHHRIVLRLDAFDLHTARIKTNVC